MLTEKRFASILEILEKDGSVTTQQLMEILNASESTIRRDLNTMDAKGLLTKVYGGAIAKDPVFNTKDENIQNRKKLNADKKRKIAKYAASLIEPADFVYMDAGTTTEYMIEYISVKDTIFVTNAISHAKLLSEKGYRVFILGGEFKSITEAIVGEEAVARLEKYNFTKGFWGTNGVSTEHGFTTPDIREALVKKKSMENCKERYVLADPSKFSQISSVKFAEFGNATIITTEHPKAGFKKYKNIVEVKEA